MARKAMTKEEAAEYFGRQEPNLTPEERIALFERMEKLEFGNDDWLMIRVPRFGDARIAHKIGRLIKAKRPEWMGDILYMDEGYGLECLHWLARMTQCDVQTVLDELAKYNGHDL